MPGMDKLVNYINKLPDTNFPFEDGDYFSISPIFQYSRKKMESLFQDIRPFL